MKPIIWWPKLISWLYMTASILIQSVAICTFKAGSQFANKHRRRRRKRRRRRRHIWSMVHWCHADDIKLLHSHEWRTESQTCHRLLDVVKSELWNIESFIFALYILPLLPQGVHKLHIMNIYKKNKIQVILQVLAVWSWWLSVISDFKSTSW